LALLAKLSRDCRKRVWSACIAEVRWAIDDEAVAVLRGHWLDRLGYVLDHRHQREVFEMKLHAPKVPGFSKEIDPKDVQISCDKNGYRQLRVVRRSSTGKDPKIPIETECTLQKT
jgi:hypothetical protein